MEYPKIQTLFNRLTEGKKKGNVIEGEYRWPEFEMVNKWYVTEKIDGTNVRVTYKPQYKTKGRLGPTATIEEFEKTTVRYSGRTDNAQLHATLVNHLQDTYTLEKLAKVFPEKEEFPMYPRVVLFMEGYGPKIQKGGNYRNDVSTRLFDVFIYDSENPLGGWWLEPDNVEDVANKIGIKTVPIVAVNYPTEEVVELVKVGRLPSQVARDEGGNEHYKMEGIVARTKPLLFTRRGKRLIWKLKVKDFPHSLATKVRKGE